MSSVFLRLFLRSWQVIGFLIALAGLFQIKPFFAELQAQGPRDWPALCWKILAITGPLVPGVLLMVGVELGLRHFNQLYSKKEKPWLANPQWAAKHIKLSNRNTILTCCIAAIAYLTIAVPLAIASEKMPMQIFIGVIGLFLLLLTRVFWQNRKWNTAELRMADVPGVIGGPFSGVAILQQSFPEGTSFEICLKCEQTVRSSGTGNSEGSTNRTSTIWSSTIYINKTLRSNQPGQTHVPFSFAIPYDSPSTSSLLDSGSDTFDWKLNVNIKDKPSAGGSVFVVPVFKTAESRPDFKFADELVEAYLEEVNVPVVLERLRMQRSKTAQGFEQMTFRVWDRSVFISICVMTVVCIVGLFAIFWFTNTWTVAIFLSLIPAVLVGIFLYVMIEMLFWSGCIEITEDSIRCEAGILGFRRKEHAPRDTSTQVECMIDYRKQNGEWWCLKIMPPPTIDIVDGENTTTRFMTIDEMKRADVEGLSSRSVKVVKQLNGRVEAEAIQQWLADQIGASAEKPKLSVYS